MWEFPYYMERQHRTDMTMSDYRVTNSDHIQFNAKEDAVKLGSQVRLFTSIPQAHTSALPWCFVVNEEDQGEDRDQEPDV